MDSKYKVIAPKMGRNLSSKIGSSLWRRILLVTIAGLVLSVNIAESARLKRAVMMDMDDNVNCISGTITERNSSTSIILTGTVKKCDKVETRPEKYSCRVQVWRIMKGRTLAGDLIEILDEPSVSTMYTKSYVEIFGLGNRGFCDSEVTEDKTRIFFLNRVEDRLVLAASLLKITLRNLENTEKVIGGEDIEEEPKKPTDPCLFVLCGFGAKCEASPNGTATCICPKVTCGMSPDSSDIYAPVCGTDGVTYPSECRLKAAQCWSQRRIRIASDRPCSTECEGAGRHSLACKTRRDGSTRRRPDTTASVPSTSPLQEIDPCKGVICGNSAKCVAESGVAKCQCLSCDKAVTNPVCGSDQNTYRSECDLRRAACMNARNLQIVRRAPCEPCVVYNESAMMFERKCAGICTLDMKGKPQCCDEISCEATDDMMMCGSDGRTYMSRCALLRYACKSGKDITEFSVGSCPSGRETTMIRGSTSIAADEKCPGNCDESSPEFMTFKKAFERDMNKNLDRKNRGDIDNKMLTDFKIDEVRRGSAVLIYSARITWFDKPIGEDFTPGEDALWAFQWLHDPAQGVLKQVISSLDVTLVAYKNPADDFVVEEVCGSLQCENGASCMLSKDESGGFLYSCDCSAIGDSKRLPITLGCKLANNNHFYDNKIAVKQASCVTRTFLTFRDVCRDLPPTPCDDLQCDSDGSTCIVTNGVASCECVTCEEDFEPVCGSNDRTYRNLCELTRENCLSGTSITVKKEGMCASQCDEVDCRHGGQCEELSQGNALCICPSNCVEVYSPVCGSDGTTYENDCVMTVASCNQKVEITVVKRGECDGTEPVLPTEGPTEPDGSGIEGSGGSNECNCRFGATCDATVDDEDGRCVCNIKCEGLGTTVCGSDGITYFSACELMKAQCKQQTSIKIVSQGKCPDHCSKSVFGCCDDRITPAKGSRKAGCPETCQCNEHGSFSPLCNHTTGQCVCRPGVGGHKCDQCQPGFWNFRAIAEKRSIGCMNCRCEKGGAVRDDCDQMTGQCMCKDGVTGVKCSKCDSGEWVTLDGCIRESERETASSCEELNCEFGQECVELVSQSGRHQCQCPPLSSCDTYSNGQCVTRKKVCASNGITYADECQMRVVACRESKVVTVLAEGTCEKYFKSLGPVIPPIVEVSSTASSTTTRTTTTSSATTTTTSPTMTVSSTVMAYTTSTIKPTPTKPSEMESTSTSTPTGEEDRDEMTGEGSGDDTFNPDFDGPPDDEDTESETESSGDDMVFPTDNFPDGLITPESVATFKVKVDLLSAGGSDLVFSEDLRMKDSELYAEYSSSIQSKISTILQKMPSNGGVLLSSITDIDIEPSDARGVTATFTIDISTMSSRAEIENFMNDNLLPEESLSFTDSVVRPIEPPLTNFTYVEDGEWTTPQFGGASYMEFSRMEAYSAATIHIRFKTADSEGLLLYNGQKEGRDFISLAVIGGYVEFRMTRVQSSPGKMRLEFNSSRYITASRFDTGSGQLSLRSAVPVNDGRWHNVVSRRNRREGMLKVDDEQEVAGTSPSRTTSVNLDTSLFVGWVSDMMQNKVSKQTSVTKGLTGCISSVRVGQHGQKELNMASEDKEAINCYRVAQCAASPCLPNPCLHSSKCFITYQLEEFTYKCECGYRYYGDRCQHRTIRDTCASSPCHESSTCVEDEDSYRCICPDSRTGVHCENLIADLPLPSTMEPSYMPMFAGDSYIQRPSLTSVSTRLDIEIVFYTFQLEGLIFYNAQEESGEGDFIALNLRNGYLEFMYDLGEGKAIITSNTKVSLNKWHVAKLSRVMRVGDLKLDNEPIVKGESPNSHSQLNLGQPLYIGYVPDTVTFPPQTHITTGLMGAIQKFVVNNVMLPRSLVDEDATSYHVQAFNGHACYRRPCLHDGICVPDLGNFTCDCKPGFSGKTCYRVEEGEEDVTMLQDPLRQAVFFDGFVKAQYENFITRRVANFKDNHFEFQMRTTADKGLIFYDGKRTKRGHGDFIALGLNHGLLHLTYDLGSGPTNIVSDLPVNDGTWKTVKIVRNENRASLQIDDMPPKQVAGPQLTKWLNTDGILWLGGCHEEHMPQRHRALPKSFHVGFKGCIRRFRIDGDLLRLREDVLNRPGLATCQDR